MADEVVVIQSAMSIAVRIPGFFHDDAETGILKGKGFFFKIWVLEMQEFRNALCR